MNKKSNQEVEEAFKLIDKQFDATQKKNKYLKFALMTPIHEKYPYAQNGITAMIALVGYNYLKLMAKQENLFNEPFYELIVICSTSSKFDKTVMTFREAIKKSKIVAVKDSDLLDYLNEYMNRVYVYNTIMRFINEGLKWDKMSEEMAELLLQHTGLRTFNSPKTIQKGIKFIASTLKELNWKTYPHRMLLILDDFASHPLLRSKETEMSRLLKKLRHFNINVIICVQTVKSIPKDLKRGLSDIIIFPGISEDDFYDLFKEAPLGCFNVKECYNVYKSLTNKHDRMSFHINANRIIVTNCDKNKT